MKAPHGVLDGSDLRGDVSGARAHNPVVRDVLLAVMASMAAMERARISERTKAGLDRVRARGVVLGRKPLDGARQAEIMALAAEGLTAYAIGKRLGVDIKTAQRYMA